MRYVLCVMLLAVCLVAWECAANSNVSGVGESGEKKETEDPEKAEEAENLETAKQEPTTTTVKKEGPDESAGSGSGIVAGGQKSLETSNISGLEGSSAGSTAPAQVDGDRVPDGASMGDLAKQIGKDKGNNVKDSLKSSNGSEAQSENLSPQEGAVSSGVGQENVASGSKGSTRQGTTLGVGTDSENIRDRVDQRDHNSANNIGIISPTTSPPGQGGKQSLLDEGKAEGDSGHLCVVDINKVSSVPSASMRQGNTFGTASGDEQSTVTQKQSGSPGSVPTGSLPAAKPIKSGPVQKSSDKKKDTKEPTTLSGDIKNKGNEDTLAESRPSPLRQLERQKQITVLQNTKDTANTDTLPGIQQTLDAPSDAKESLVTSPSAENKVDSSMATTTERVQNITSPTDSKDTAIAPTIPLHSVLPLPHSVDKTDFSLGSSSLFALAALATLAVAAAAPAH